jgi:hypothetical protein
VGMVVAEAETASSTATAGKKGFISNETLERACAWSYFRLQFDGAKHSAEAG